MSGPSKTFKSMTKKVLREHLQNLDPNSQEGKHVLTLTEATMLFSMHLIASSIALKLLGVFFPSTQDFYALLVLANICLFAINSYNKKYYEMERDKFFGRPSKWWWKVFILER